MKYLFPLIAGTLLLQSCASLRDTPKYQLSEGYYKFRQPTSQYKKVYIRPEGDSVKIYPIDGEAPIAIMPSKDEYFKTGSFDVDVMTILFKYRPARSTIRQQLNTNFNGNLYLGYRLDRFQVDFEQTPAGLKKASRHRALTFGLFGGIGSTSVNPSTTANQITNDYDGVVISKGFAAMAGINSLTVGVGIGWDSLLGRDNDVWVHQNSPWFGLTLGLNLN